MLNKKLIFLSWLCAWLLLPFQGVATPSQKNHEEQNRKGSSAKAVSAKTGDQAERAMHAANVVMKLVHTPESNIPDELLERAHAIAVVPNIIKAALGVGGLHGKGLVVKKTPNGWGTPAFIDLNGGSFGFQIGVSATDLVLVFTREDGLKGLLEDKLELGGEAGVAAGPVGRAAELGTNVTFDSPIYSYSRSKGLFAGIALKGSVMTIDDSANHKVYGDNVSGTDILVRGTVKPNAVVRPFLEALRSPEVRLASKSNPNEKTVDRTPAPDRVHTPAPARTQVNRTDIKKAQEALRDKGYSPGPIDGALGPQTREAIRKYQTAENLPVTGRLDAQTSGQLGIATGSPGK